MTIQVIPRWCSEEFGIGYTGADSPGAPGSPGQDPQGEGQRLAAGHTVGVLAALGHSAVTATCQAHNRHNNQQSLRQNCPHLVSTSQQN